ncbi:MAG: hypothetical protein Q4P07_10865 [Ornithinimicrobium sp.]|uniref:hypothetical protein n=1 Tax=Ornithinimicrobium sp. TaxID=1977084 RepID=UPI0026DF5B15|nr:hypothetical protein [Ornithinimicrobium sp.]MDO5740637.1 hypothetical protein [Ornithinimicrobium sp.]
MSSKAERRAERESVAAFHEAELAKLVGRVGEAIDGFRSGRLDAFEVDRVLFQYSRAAKKLWKFCNLGPVELTASLITRDDPSTDWWERGTPRRR